jgi:hypothetical protein
MDFALEQPMKAQREVEVQLYSFFNLGAEWRWVVKPHPGPFSSWEETR